METEFAILDDGDTPLCASCGKPMQFVRSIPRLAALPELRTYECKPCGITYTAAVELTWQQTWPGSSARAIAARPDRAPPRSIAAFGLPMP